TRREREKPEGARSRGSAHVPGGDEGARRESRKCARGLQTRRREILQGHCARGRANPVLPESPAGGAQPGVRGRFQARGESQAARPIAATARGARNNALGTWQDSRNAIRPPLRETGTSTAAALTAEH